MNSIRTALRNIGRRESLGAWQQHQFIGELVSDLVGASPIGASVTEAKMQASDFSNTHWQRSKLTHSAFTSCKLSGADFSGASVLGIEFADCILKDAFLSGVSFLKERVETIDFSGADLNGSGSARLSLV